MRVPKVLGAVAIAAVFATSCAPVPSDGATRQATIAQVQPTLGYVTLDVARAFNTFSAEKIRSSYIQVGGGDTAALAALESGNVNFAAVGSEAPLVALAKNGGDYQIVYSVMSQMSLEFTVSRKFLAKAGVSATDPLDKRLKALKGARIGVSALGGAQDKAVRWLAKRAGLDAAKDVQILNGGPPSALQAGMQNDRFDAFALTAPNGEMTEREGYGKVLIRPGTEIPELKGFSHLVLVTRKEFAEKNPQLVKAVASAFSRANDLILDKPGTVTTKLRKSTYKQIPADVLRASLKTLSPGLQPHGRLTEQGIATVIKFAADTGHPIVGTKLDAHDGQGEWWTNDFTIRNAR